ncbi:glutathione S-transferase family protein [Massilia sp. W12]|uniref:glutathione S-transferase family protein n=1 Tax=Massilia sp. W12 TaxID=3126507 RepID=UPI0030D1F4F7
MLTLYEFALSGNCHKVRLLLSFLGLEYRSVLLNGAQGEHKTPQFLALNPLGQVPLLEDGPAVVRDSQAILVYLARRYGAAQSELWLPADALSNAHVAAWLSVAAYEVARGPNALRLHHKWGRALELEQAQAISMQLLQMMEARLSGQHWLAASHITIADVALYPYLALSKEAQLSLAEYPAVRAWLARIEAMPGYLSMPGIVLQAQD